MVHEKRSKTMATEDKLWIPPLSSKDQQKVDRLLKKQGKASNRWIGFSGRTLWEWLNLLGVLAVPFVVTLIGLYFTQQVTEQQALVGERQHQTDLRIAQDNRQNDLKIANDQQQETTLKTYLDDMSDLLLNHNLHSSKLGDEVREVARERTLTTLRRLKADRNKVVLQFLQDAHLIGMKNAFIDLSRADMSGDDLRGVNLNSVNLIGANLNGASLSGASLYKATLVLATLSGANLESANLESANLSEASLYGANLSEASLYGANLSGASLHGANLSGASLYGAHTGIANLSDADLSDADLYSTTVTQEQLAQAYSLKGAIMPDGTKHA
jgi:uncharacterized protein YjbI with pentapeptide repeats